MTKDDLQKVRDALLNSAGHNPDCGLFTLNHNGNYLPCDCGINEALAILDAALAAPEPQPAVWMQSDHLHKAIGHACGADSFLARCSHRQLMPDYQPLFLAPPSREWQGLSADEIQRTLEVCQTTVSDPLWSAFAEAIEAALKEKNHG